MTTLARGSHASWTVAFTRKAHHACTHALGFVALTIATPAADAEGEDVVTANLALPGRPATRHIQWR